MPEFKVESLFQPAGDQPHAIAKLTEGIERGDRFQTLLGITGSGKSATIAWTIEATQRPTLILAPNKSLAAQLTQEMREFFPNNRVEYFVSGLKQRLDLELGHAAQPIRRTGVRATQWRAWLGSRHRQYDAPSKWSRN